MVRKKLSKEEIELKIAQGENKRSERLEKRQALSVEDEKQKILQQCIVEADDYHKGLRNRLQIATRYLHDVIEGRKVLETPQIPRIIDLFKSANDLDARVAYRMCREDYQQLVIYCWRFHAGVATALGLAAFEYWDKMVAFPEVQVTGTVILNILNSGSVYRQTLLILKHHKAKFEESELAPFIVHTAKRLLRDGGYFDGKQKKSWTPAQIGILQEIVKLFLVQDNRILEEIAEDSE